MSALDYQRIFPENLVPVLEYEIDVNDILWNGRRCPNSDRPNFLYLQALLFVSKYCQLKYFLRYYPAMLMILHTTWKIPKKVRFAPFNKLTFFQDEEPAEEKNETVTNHVKPSVRQNCHHSQPSDLEAQCHTFRSKIYKRPRNCQLCKQLIWNNGSACRVCKYACHKRCESQVMTTCVPPVNYELQSNETSNKHQAVRGHPSPSSRGIMSNLKHKMVKNREQGPWELDLTYITERIIAMSFPEEGSEGTYRNSQREVAQMLKSKHGDNYMIINLSERREEMHKLHHQVLDFGWPDHLSPPLERLCSICKSIDSWLNSDPQHVVVVHCKGGRGRTGVVIAAYMHYSNICARGRVSTLAGADQALDRFAMKRFYDDKLGGVTQPSQRRYVHYFAGLLSGGIKINSRPMFLHHLIIHGVPNFDSRGGCRPFIKIYQALQPVFTSGVYTVTSSSPQICISLQPCVQLRGDILIKCYHKRFRSATRDVIFRCQFHTCAVSDYHIVFAKKDLDDAATDPRFPDHSTVELTFSQSSNRIKTGDVFEQAALAAEDSSDPLVRWDSYENFNNNDDSVLDTAENGESEGSGESHVRVMHVQRTQGPVDGSLYARVNRTRQETQTASTHSTSAHSTSAHSTSAHSTSGLTANGGPGILPNGPLNISHDSGISSSSGRKQGHTSGVNVASQSASSNMALTANIHQKLPDEQTQLDEIINELLGDQLFSTSPTSSRQVIGNPQQGSLTTDSGNSRTILSWESNQSGPTKSTTVSKQTRAAGPGSRSESVTVSKKEVTRDGQGGGYNMQRSSQQRSESSSSYKSDKQGRVGSPIEITIGSPTPSRLHSLPYQVDYDNRFGESYMPLDYFSDSEGPHNWLAAQQMKLRQKREGKVDYGYRTEQEKQLVHELKSAQMRFKSKRAQSEAEEEAILAQYSNRDVFASQNGPVFTVRTPSPEKTPPLIKPTTPEPPPRRHISPPRRHTSPPRSRSSPPRTHRSPPRKSRSPERSLKQESFIFRTTSPRPVRREFVSPEPLRRSHSMDRSHSMKTEKTYFVSGLERPAFTTHQTKYVFSISPPKSASSSYSEHSAIRSKPPPSPATMRASAPTSPLIPARVGYSPRLDELERSLQVATTYSPATKRRTSAHSAISGYESDDFLSRTYSSFEEKSSMDEMDRNQPEEIEEEIISLQPIGRGMQNLEPDGRTTPGFPVSGTMVATPPFPVTPRTPYVNYGSPAPPPQPQVVTRSMQQHQQHSNQQYQQSNSTLQHGGAPPTMGVQSVPPSGAMIQQERVQGVHTLPPGGMPQQHVVQQHSSHAESASSSLQQHHTTQQVNGQAPPSYPAVQQMSSERRMQQQQQYSVQQSGTLPPGSASISHGGSTGSSQQYTSQQQQYRSQSQQYSSQSSGGNIVQHQPPGGSHDGIQEAQIIAQQAPPRQASAQNAVHQDYRVTQQRSQSSQQNGLAAPTTQALTVDTNQKVMYAGMARSPSSTGSQQSPPSPSSSAMRSQLSTTQTSHTQSSGNMTPGNQSFTGQSSPGSHYYGQSRSGSFSSVDSMDILQHTPRFVRDTSKYWYKPHISREEAINMLKDKQAGTFVVRDSNSFQGAFGLALKVAHLPPNVQTKPGDPPGTEYVRHFLIEPTPKGVKLKGCSNEPVFGSLAALVYQHSITPLALPCKLLLPEADPAGSDKRLDLPTSEAQLLTHGAACNVMYLGSVDMESLTGPEAVSKTVKEILKQEPPPKTTVVHFKVSTQGITLTDNKRRLFFRRHYPINTVTYCGMDPDDRRWSRPNEDSGMPMNAKVFGFVARKQGSTVDNACHLFAELDPEQPAGAIVHFVTKVMIGPKSYKAS